MPSFLAEGGKHGMNAMSNPLKEAWKGGGEGLEVHLDDPKGGDK